MLGQLAVQNPGIPAQSSKVKLLNKTGQSLVPGNVIEMDTLQVGALSTPTAAQLAANLDEANIAFNNAYITTAAGIAAGASMPL